MRVSPLRASQQAPASKLAQNSHPPGPGLAAVAAAVARLAAQLAAGCGQQPPAAESASALALLLGVLCPLTPREAVAIGMALLPPVLQQGAASGWHGCGGDSAQLASLLRLALFALEAVLIRAAGQGDTAAAAVSPVSPPQLLAALQQAWVANVSADKAQAATAAAAPAESSRVAAMCACLAAVQADLLDPTDMLGLLRRELQGYLEHDTAPASSTVGDLAAAAATLLPAACIIGAAREHQVASQPRATQGGRRQKQAQAHQAHPPSPLVSALHRLVSSASEAPPAGLSFADAAAERQRRQAVLAAVAQGLLCVVSHAQDPLHLALAAIDAACNKGSGTSAWTLLQMLQGPLGCAAGAECHPPSLPSGVSEWVRLALERLAAAELPAEGQVGGAGGAAVVVGGWMGRHATSCMEEYLPACPVYASSRLQQRPPRSCKPLLRASFPNPPCLAFSCRRCWWMLLPPSCSVPPRASWSMPSRWCSGSSARRPASRWRCATRCCAGPLSSQSLRCGQLLFFLHRWWAQCASHTPAAGVRAVSVCAAVPWLDHSAAKSRPPGIPDPHATPLVPGHPDAVPRGGAPHPHKGSRGPGGVPGASGRWRAGPIDIQHPCGCLAGAGMRPTQPPAAGMPLTDALTHELLPALQMLQALREKLEALEAPAAGSGRSASSIEATREGLVQARHAWQHMLHLLPSAMKPRSGFR